jgi:repressor LexA
LAIHHTAEARSGQIVVAQPEDKVTVKRHQRRRRVELMAENPDYAPIVVNGPLVIEGLVVGLIRGGRTL